MFASETVGWLGIGLGAGGVNVGTGGLLRTRDGGRTWDCRTDPANVSAVSAADPLNLAGIIVPGARVPALHTNAITFRDGLPITVEEGRTVRSLEADPATAYVAAGE